MYRSFTRSLLKPLNLQAAMYALISQLTLVCNMQLNVLDDLAEAMKALDGRKKTDCLLAPSARPLVAHLLTKMDEFQCNN